jgi:hypothetical protein
MFCPSLRKFNAFSGAVPEKIQFCASGFAASDRFDVDHIRRIDWERPFDTFVLYNTANGEVLVHAAAAFGDYDTGKNLYAALVAFLDFTMYVNGIAYLKVWLLVFDILLFY